MWTQRGTGATLPGDSRRGDADACYHLGLEFGEGRRRYRKDRYRPGK
ncbi:hypothetical protein SC1_00815 [Sphingopyxis sp. C-1]|nr:hypothetical protein SC1_00815 [Sphingopyxis sp. C-1]